MRRALVLVLLVTACAGKARVHPVAARATERVREARETAYVLGGDQVDPVRGVYLTDCSGWAAALVDEVAPEAMAEVRLASGKRRPLARHFYEYFTTAGASARWRPVARVEDLRPGDVVVWRYSQAYRRARGLRSTGHMVVVVGPPVRDPRWPGAYRLTISDAAKSPHSDDTRPEGTGGVGVGTLLLRADPLTGGPVEFAWTLAGRWQDGVAFAMARVAAD